jgi:hypothetical protein
MTINSTSKSKEKKSVVSTKSPVKKVGRKVLSDQNLQFSPRIKTPNVNKVFLVGVQLGLILLRTQRPNSTDDAFTHTANLMIEDPETGVASRLKIVKICSKRVSQMIDKAILQSSSYASQWYVSITEESKNTVEYRRNHANEFIKFLNDTNWKYPQKFMFAGDETKIDGKVILGHGTCT